MKKLWSWVQEQRNNNHNVIALEAMFLCFLFACVSILLLTKFVMWLESIL